MVCDRHMAMCPSHLPHLLFSLCGSVNILTSHKAHTTGAAGAQRHGGFGKGGTGDVAREAEGQGGDLTMGALTMQARGRLATALSAPAPCHALRRTCCACGGRRGQACNSGTAMTETGDIRARTETGVEHDGRRLLGAQNDSRKLAGGGDHLGFETAGGTVRAEP